MKGLLLPAEKKLPSSPTYNEFPVFPAVENEQHPQATRNQPMVMPQPQSQYQHDAAYKKYGDDDLPFSHVLKVKEKCGLCKRLRGFCWRCEKGDLRYKTQDSRRKTQDSRRKKRDARLKTQDTRYKTQDTRYKKQEQRIENRSYGPWSIDYIPKNQFNETQDTRYKKQEPRIQDLSYGPWSIDY
ncbi:putative capsule O-acetyl transferase [Mariniradius saccharolyticus AK6]|uniref:Capsule O-acetyl transferase n=1 Tax=Mariniradius saccharolyticus AK6 TaxID=1239962 RepID=M7XQY1_9BACT|nr:putative capsule O-acetyl transferase [Mariniradius saccharolyticus AK6]